MTQVYTRTSEATLLAALIQPFAERAEIEYLYWIECFDETGVCHCLKCAEEYQEEQLIKRGIVAAPYTPIAVPEDLWINSSAGFEYDNPEHCVVCGVRLYHCLSDYAKQGEYAHFIENGIDLDPDDCYDLMDALCGWGSAFMPQENNDPKLELGFQKLRMQVEELIFAKYGDSDGRTTE
ncbi:hypothetical protein CCAX7_54110 [Capsulimonas corticalis]|uniref:Uncharacterized protein n=1 Tax=Capsulimonas corticalis TaxID=2219043 RepID=A0A402CNF6_9BACT|nr:hypothetical protein [Capsulimonas corticalis]BDI33360.1 hypothetical protein CCAX7_54110 [Capsulimonas corticalis]